MPDRLYFTDSDEANELIAKDPMALLIGFSLDQQVTVGQAFLGPLRLRERLRTLEPAAVAAADLEPLFRQKPAIHRFPAKMAERVHDLAGHVGGSRRHSPASGAGRGKPAGSSRSRSMASTRRSAYFSRTTALSASCVSRPICTRVTFPGRRRHRRRPAEPVGRRATSRWARR